LTNNSRNSNARPRIKLSSLSFRKCRAIRRSRITRSGSRKRGASGRKIAGMAPCFSYSHKITRCTSRLVMGWRAHSPISRHSTSPSIKSNRVSGRTITRADSPPGSIPSSKRSAESTKVPGKLRANERGLRAESFRFRFCSFSSSRSSFLSCPAFLVNVGTDIPDLAARSLVVGRADPAAAGRRVAVAASAALAAEAELAAGAEPGRVGEKMRTKKILSKLEHDRIIRAIQEAEAKTSGEIRVYIQRGNLNGDALAAVQKKFHKLGMHRTGERNGVLIFVAPRAHKFAVVGDKAIHEK